VITYKEPPTTQLTYPLRPESSKYPSSHLTYPGSATGHCYSVHTLYRYAVHSRPTLRHAHNPATLRILTAYLQRLWSIGTGCIYTTHLPCVTSRLPWGSAHLWIYILPITFHLPSDLSRDLEASKPVKTPRRRRKEGKKRRRKSGKEEGRKGNSQGKKPLKSPGKFSQPAYPTTRIWVTRAFCPDLLLLQGRSDPVPPTGVTFYKASTSRRVAPSSPYTKVQHLSVIPP
jgi:hypothetical protein